MAYNYQMVATNSPTSFNAVGLPPGLSINTATRLISGTPTGTAGIYAATLTATNGFGTTAMALTITVGGPLSNITSPLTAYATLNAPFTYQITGEQLSPPPATLPLNFHSGYPVNQAIRPDFRHARGRRTVLRDPASIQCQRGEYRPPRAFGRGPARDPKRIDRHGGPRPAIQLSRSRRAAFPRASAATGLPAGLSLNPATGLISGTSTASGTTFVILSATSAYGTRNQLICIDRRRRAHDHQRPDGNGDRGSPRSTTRSRRTILPRATVPQGCRPGCR